MRNGRTERGERPGCGGRAADPAGQQGSVARDNANLDKQSEHSLPPSAVDGASKFGFRSEVKKMARGRGGDFRDRRTRKLREAEEKAYTLARQKGFLVDACRTRTALKDSWEIWCQEMKWPKVVVKPGEKWSKVTLDLRYSGPVSQQGVNEIKRLVDTVKRKKDREDAVGRFTSICVPVDQAEEVARRLCRLAIDHAVSDVRLTGVWSDEARTPADAANSSEETDPACLPVPRILPFKNR